jgi:pimeloyl-ACP methyl ester carboxylesterase
LILRQPIEHYGDLNNTRFCWFEWGTPNSDPTIVLIHATGFHARCWDQVVAHLGDRHVLALDLRHHGRSEKGDPCGWEVYSTDVIAFIEAQDLDNIVLVGHSMGGYCAANALCEIGHRVTETVLVDPVIMDPETYTDTHERHESFLNDDNEHPVARRRNHFVDADAMYKNFEGRGSYASWKPEALHDYCEHGLQSDEENGGYKLACPPHLEASIYMGSMSQPIFDGFGKVTVPVTIMRAKRVEVRTTLDFTLSPTWPGLAAQFMNGRDVYLPELTHFMPMQAPELVAQYILGER